MRKKRTTLFIISALFVWQFSSLFPWRVEQLYPSLKLDKVARNQVFIVDTAWSFWPGSISGCFFYPNLYNASGEKIQTAGGVVGGKRFVEPDSMNDVLLQEGEVVDVVVKAVCGIWMIEDVLFVYEVKAFQQRYTVGGSMLSREEKVSIFQKFSDQPSEVLNLMFE